MPADQCPHLTPSSCFLTNTNTNTNPPPPLTVSLTVNYTCFFTPSLYNKKNYRDKIMHFDDWSCIQAWQCSILSLTIIFHSWPQNNRQANVKLWHVHIFMSHHLHIGLRYSEEDLCHKYFVNLSSSEGWTKRILAMWEQTRKAKEYAKPGKVLGHKYLCPFYWILSLFINSYI